MKKKRIYAPGHKSELQLAGLVLVLILASLIAMMCSCTTTRTVQVPVEVEKTVLRTDTLRLYSHSIDTVVERDSVFVWQRGDTVTKEVTRWRYKVKLLADTVWQTRTDSVYVEKPVTVTVEREMGLWESFKIRFGGMAISIVCVLIIGACILAALKYRNRI